MMDGSGSTKVTYVYDTWRKKIIDNLEKLIATTHRYKNLGRIIIYVMRELIMVIYVDRLDKGTGK